MQDDDVLKLAETIRHELLRRMEAAYEEAGQSGLCAEGRWELAVDRARSLDLRGVLKEKGVLAADERG